MERGFSAGIDPEDQVIAGLGFGLSVFSGYKRVMNADGTDTSAHDALELIYQEIDQWIQRTADDDIDAGVATKED